jgi:hypothetical protein
MVMRLYSRSFAGGEVSPAMYGRIDNVKNQTGVALGYNGVFSPTGSFTRRGGGKHVGATSDGATKTSVSIPFEYSADDTILVVASAGFFQFVELGAFLTHPVAAAWSNATAYVVGDLASRLGVTYYCILAHTNQQPPNSTYWYAQPASGRYEVPNPYVESNLPFLNYDQSFDVLTITHDDHVPRELRRTSATRWVLSAVSLTTPLAAPTGLAATRTFGFYQAVTYDNASPSLFTISSSRPHGFVDGVSDVYIEATIGTGVNQGAGTAALSSGYYKVSTTPNDWTFTLKTVDGGAVVSAGIAGSAVYRELSLSSNVIEKYVVTALDEAGRESVPSSELSVTNNLHADGATNALSWNAVTGAVRYYVYKKQANGVFAFIGQATSNAFTDDDIGPDESRTPPTLDTTLAGTSNDYPACCGHFEGRRWFAATDNRPSGLWGTRSNTESDLSYRIPQLATDRIYNGITTRRLAIIRHIVPTSHLLLLTSSGEYRVTPLNQDAITPESISVRNESNVGCTNVRPVQAGDMTLFVSARNQHIIEFGIKEGRFKPDDLSTWAKHLFDGIEIACAAYSRQPFPVAWFVTSDGRLLSCTYMPEQNVAGWSWHEHGDGDYEWVSVIAEGDEDAVYVHVRRTVNSLTVRHIERLASLTVPAAIEDCTYLDGFITYDSTATTSITGLSHHEGEDVYALADGEVVGPFTVASGGITLDTAASTVQVGLPYTTTLRTLPIAAQVDGYGKGRHWNVSKVMVNVEDSAQFEARQYNAQVAEAQRSDFFPVYLTSPDGGDPMPIDELTDLATVEVNAEGGWQADGQIELRQASPLPLNVLSLTIAAEAGN